jgi:glutathione S-transferase
MKLYSHPNSTFSRRVRIALHEKGLRAEEIERDKAARGSAEFRALNPYGRIPTLVDGDLVLYESSAILTWLEERYPERPLLPPDAAGRARAAMHVKLCDIEFTPHAIRVQRAKRMEPESTWDHAAFAAASAAVARHYVILERELEGKEYLVGGVFTHADVAYLPFLHFHHLLEVALPPNIAAWHERLAHRDSARATIPAV